MDARIWTHWYSSLYMSLHCLGAHLSKCFILFFPFWIPQRVPSWWAAVGCDLTLCIMRWWSILFVLSVYNITGQNNQEKQMLSSVSDFQPSSYEKNYPHLFSIMEKLCLNDLFTSCHVWSKFFFFSLSGKILVLLVLRNWSKYFSNHICLWIQMTFWNKHFNWQIVKVKGKY